MTFPDGPRDWSPRMARGMALVRKIEAAIPSELLVHAAEESLITPSEEIQTPSLRMRKVGDIYTALYFREGIQEHKDLKIMLLVKIGNYFEEVSLCTDGGVHMGPTIPQLLDGYVRGYEYLAKRPNPLRS